MWQWCSNRSISAAAITPSPSTCAHSSKLLFEVSTVDALLVAGLDQLEEQHPPSRLWITFSCRARKPSSCRLSICSRLMLGWKAKSNCARVLTADSREGAHGGLQAAVVAQHDLGPAQILDRL